MSKLELNDFYRVHRQVNTLRFPNSPQVRADANEWLLYTLERVILSNGTIELAQNAIDEYTKNLLWDLSELLEEN